MINMAPRKSEWDVHDDHEVLAIKVERPVRRRKIPSRGVCAKIEFLPPEKPNSEPRRIALVKFPNGDEASAYIPRGAKGVTEGAPVFVRASRSPKVPGIDLRARRYKPAGSAQGEPGFTWQWRS